MSRKEVDDPTSCVDAIAALEARTLNSRATGRLAPEVIRERVHNQYGVLRSCYETGLSKNPELKGRVTVSFAIDRNGKVEAPYISDNELPDCGVATCIRDGFLQISFPPPDDGIVTVRYPIVLQPG